MSGRNEKSAPRFGATAGRGLWADENGKLRVGLGTDNKGPRLALVDTVGKVIWSAP